MSERLGGVERSKARYDLSTKEVNELTQELLSSHPPSGDGGVECYELPSNSRFCNIGRYVEIRVFWDVYESTNELMVREYSPYENQSRFFVTVDTAKRVPVGVLRMIEDGPAGLKTLNDLEEYLPEEEMLSYHDIDKDSCWDVGTLAVVPEYRGSGLPTAMMLRGAYKALQDRKVEHVVTAMESKPYEKIVKNVFDAPYVPLAGMDAIPYLGSESTQPLYSHVPSYEKSLRASLERSRDDMARLAISAVLDGTMVDRYIHEADDS